jgi:hypothetical protein
MPIRSKISGIARRSALNIGNFINSLRDQSPAAAAAFAQIESAVHAIENTLQRGDSTIEGLTITNPSGAEIIRLDPSGFISIHDQSGLQAAWLGEQSDIFPLAITAATNASPTVITITAHGYIDGDTVLISGATSNTAINGYRIVTASTANTFRVTDLLGAAINGNGAYAGAATAKRYYAGLLAQTIAIGPSFADYKLRAFADGSLKIRNASLHIESGTVTLDINATDVFKIVDTAANGKLQYIGGTALRVGQADDSLYVQINKTSIAILSATATQFEVRNTGNLFLRDSGGTIQIQLNAINGDATIGRDVLAGRTVDAITGFSRNGVAGLSVSRSFGTSLTVNTGSAVTGTPGAGQSTGTFVTGVSLNVTANTFSGGILTV